MSDKREVDLKNKLDEATNADQEKKAFLKNFFEDEEPLNKTKKAKPSRKQINDRNANSRPSTTAANKRPSKYASPIKTRSQPSKSASAKSLRAKTRTAGSGSSRLYDRRPTTSQSLRGKRGPPVRKSPKKYAPINMDIINRLSKPRQKKKPSKYHVQPSSATGRWSKPGGGRFSNARPKSDIEIKMLR